jgi:hypothetical protein
VRDAFAAEKPHLLALPELPFPTDETVQAQAGKTPYVRFDLNDYSVPHTHVRRMLTVVADLKSLRVLDATEVIAAHARSWDRGRQIEDEAHIRALVQHKRKAREHRGMDRLHHAAPNSQQLFAQIAGRGGNLGSVTCGLIRLLDAYGAEALEQAIQEALTQGVPHLAAVRQILDRSRHARGQPPALGVTLPDDPRVRDVVIRPHRLADYEQLRQDPDDDQQD